MPNVDIFLPIILCLYSKESEEPGVSGDYRKYRQVLTVSFL